MLRTLEYLGEMKFIQFMLIAGILAGLACGLIGSIIVVRRNVFVAAGVSHTTFGGIGMAYWLQGLGHAWFDPMLGAVIFALGAALVLGFEPIKKRFREDSTIGVIWVLGMALGILFHNMTDWTDMTRVSSESILFGDILLISEIQLYIMGGLVVVIYAFVLYFFRDLEAMVFDEEFARISGIRVSIMNVILLILIALTVTLLVKVVGVVLIIAMLTIPAAISNLFTKRLSIMMIWATVIGVVLATAGVVLSIEFDAPPGATIVLLMGGVFLIAILGKFINTRVHSFLKSS
ncbi:MAG: metal ABC transporter permease [Thermoplasmatota archaeon]